MKKSKVCERLGIEHPIIQAGIPWISNPELVVAVSEAGGLGMLHPTAGMALDGDLLKNLRANVHKVQSLTSKPFGMSFDVSEPDVKTTLEAAVAEGIRIVITYGGSPALYTGFLRENDVIVLHQVASVRHARAAEAEGVDVIIAEGYEGGGPRGREDVTTMVLVPSVVDAVSCPVIASGGITDARGFVAALVLGAEGIQMGTRFVATHECIAHPNYKNAILRAIDTGTVIAGRYHIPTRLLRCKAALQLRQEKAAQDADVKQLWRERLGTNPVRAAFIDGDLEEGVAWSGAGASLVSEILGAAEVIRRIVTEAEAILHRVRG